VKKVDLVICNPICRASHTGVRLSLLVTGIRENKYRNIYYSKIIYSAS